MWSFIMSHGRKSCSIWLRNKYLWSLMEYYGHILTVNNINIERYGHIYRYMVTLYKYTINTIK